VESKTVVPQPPGDLQGTAWKLVAKNDNDAVPPAQRLTLHIDNGRASGRGPCSSYRIPFRNHGHDGEDVTTGRLISGQG
jgi:hypothetical protein